MDEDPVMGEEVEVNVCGGEENGDEVRGFEGEGCVTEMFRRREDSGDHVKLFEGEENVTEVRVNEGDVFGDLNMPPVIAGGDSIEFTLEPDGTAIGGKDTCVSLEAKLDRDFVFAKASEGEYVLERPPKRPGGSGGETKFILDNYSVGEHRSAVTEEGTPFWIKYQEGSTCWNVRRRSQGEFAVHCPLTKQQAVSMCWHDSRRSQVDCL